jgi:predicted RNA-binding protein with PUA domain
LLISTEKVYYGELGEGRGEVVRVVPGMRLKLVTGSAVEVIVEEFMEELLNQTGGIVLDVAVGDGVDPSAEVIADEAVIAVLNTSGGL